MRDLEDNVWEQAGCMANVGWGSPGKTSLGSNGGRRWGRMSYMKGKGKSQISAGWEAVTADWEGRQMGLRVIGRFLLPEQSRAERGRN